MRDFSEPAGPGLKKETSYVNKCDASFTCCAVKRLDWTKYVLYDVINLGIYCL